MRKLVLVAVGGLVIYKLLTVNPLWLKQWAPTPESVPESMLREARDLGWL